MRITAAVFGCLLIWSTAASARPIGTTPTDFWAPLGKFGSGVNSAQQASDALPGRVEESRPSIYYLPDKNGKLQPILDFKYEDFEELYKLRHRLGRRIEPPRYVLQRMTAEGQVKEGRAELTVRFRILVRDDDWVRVPLRLDQGLLRGEVQHKGPGRQFVDFEGGDAGYVCWIRGKSEAPHEITMTMLVPLDVLGDETRLKLCAPRAATSELTMTVPVAGASGTVSEGATLLSSRAAEGGATEFRVARPAGDFQLAWSKPAAPGEETPAVLEAVGTLLARLDGRGATTEATLSVKSLGAAFDRFTVRLPPEAELVVPAVSAAGYSVAPIAAAGKKGDPQRLVEVRLAKKTSGPIDVRLACRRDFDAAGEGPWIELSGFEVVAAARQWGTIGVAADGRRQVLWGPTDRTRQIDPVPDALRKENPIAAFEYFGQPFSLKVRLARQGTRTAAAPQYVLLVDRDRVQLEGRLSYTIRGAEVTTLSVSIPGWKLDGVGPELVVAGDGVAVDGDTVSIPLARPTSGPLELRLRAHREIGQSAASLAVALPEPAGDTIAPAVVAVVPADNVELIPKERSIEGLSRQAGSPPMKLPKRQQAAFYYRGTGGRALFAADVRVHPRRIAVSAAGQIAIADGAAAVQQTFSYVILYEPVGQLMLNVPRELATPGRIQASLDGQPLPLILTGDDQMTPVSLRAILPEARIGPCKLTLQYSVPAAEPAPGRPAAVAVPLAMPAEGELAANVLTVRTARNVRPRLEKDGWSEAKRLPSPPAPLPKGEGSIKPSPPAPLPKGEGSIKPSPPAPLPKGEGSYYWSEAKRNGAEYDARSGLRLTAAGPLHSLDLNLDWQKDDDARTTVVDRALIQSWFTTAARQDRAVFQFTTDRREIEMTLPPGAAEQVVVLVDGVEARPRRTAAGGLSIPLGGRGENRRVTVELRYHFTDPRPPRGAMNIEIPRLKSETWIRRTYLQLILPANEHLIAAPDGWTGEYAWSWQGGYWSRRQSIGQRTLESWAGAAPLAPETDAANRYLFSSFGKPPRVELRTAGRAWIVLWASGAALILGLLLIYVPAGRRPATLFVLGLALLAAGLIAPEPTLLLAQAAVLGLVLALLAGLLERGLIGRRPPPRKEPSSSRVELRTVGAITPPPAERLSSTGSMPSIAPQATGNSGR